MLAVCGGDSAATNALIYQTFALMLVINVAFAYSEVFHNAMLPSITPANKAGVVSGLAFALGNLSGVSLMLFVLIAFATAGVMPWAWLPERRCLGSINRSMSTIASQGRFQESGC